MWNRQAGLLFVGLSLLSRDCRANPAAIVIHNKTNLLGAIRAPRQSGSFEGMNPLCSDCKPSSAGLRVPHVRQYQIVLNFERNHFIHVQAVAGNELQTGREMSSSMHSRSRSGASTRVSFAGA